MPKIKATDKTETKSVEATPASRPVEAESKTPNAASRKALREIELGQVTIYESVEALFKKFRP